MTRGIGKVWKRRFVSWVVCAIVGVWWSGSARAESAVVIQGFQSSPEKYAANTVDAYVKALGVRGASVTTLRPQSQPGWEGGSSYTDKAGLLSQVRGAVAGQNTVAVIVGDAGSGGGLLTQDGEEVSAAELADALAGATRVAIVSAGCNAIASAVASKLAISDVVVSGMAAGQSAHTWPKGNRGQYDLFSRYLLEAYYLLSTDAGTSGGTGELLGRAAAYASEWTIHTSGGRQTPTMADTYSAPDTDGGLVSRTGNREYSFSFVSTGVGAVSGYVANALGLPIAPISSGTRSGERVAFTFTERGRDRAVVVEGGENLAVSIDDRPVSFSALPSSVDLVSDAQVVGRAYITSSVVGYPTAVVSSTDGSVASGGAYHSADRSFSFSVASADFVVQIGAFGVIQVTSRGQTYRETDVIRYGLYNDSGSRVATAAAIVSGTGISGTLSPDAGEMRLPLTGSLANGKLAGSATLVGNTYTLSDDWTWTSSRPPSSGTVQPDYLELPELERVFADASRGDGSVAITWDVDRSKVTGGLLLSDLSFQVVRTETAGGVVETFDVPAGRRTYTDRPAGDPRGYTYSLRALLDHRVTSCDNNASYPILGGAVAAKLGTPPAEPVVVAAAPVAPAAPQADEQTAAAPEATTADIEPATAAEPELADNEVERVSEPEPKEEPKKDEKDKEEDDVFRPWEKKEEEGGIASRIIYGVLGVMVIVGLAIAIGGGGSPSDQEPN